MLYLALKKSAVCQMREKNMKALEEALPYF